MNHEGIVTAARALIGVVAAAGVVVGSGCAGRSKTGDLRGSVPLSAIGAPDRAPEAAAPVDARRLPMFDGETGEAVEWPALLSRASESDVVVIGETHGHVVGLAAAACLFDDLLGASPQTALAMEFFERDQQAALDDYLTGVTDEEAFRKATGRSKGNYPDGHARMVEAAKAAGRPVIGANSPRRYVRLARTEGFDRLVALGESQRALFVVPAAMTEGRYRDEFMKMATSMAGHGAPEKEEEEMTPEEKERKAQEEALGFFRSQNLWDATMAESIVRLVAAGAEPVVMVVGRFHSEYDGGLTQRVRESLPSARVLTVTMVDESSDALREEDKGRGGVVVYVGKDGE